MALLKSLALLTSFGVASALAPGDCAFVGIYGDQDDFALVLLEEAAGESLFLTEEFPKDTHFEVSKFVAAKKHVKDAARGAVLKKADFETDSASLVAPTTLTVFSGSATAPTVLCSINMEAKPGNVARKLNEEVSVVMLGMTETAQYAGSTSGSKEELLEDISNPGNWLHDASRKLSGFSIAKGGNVTMTTTLMMGSNMTTTTVMTTTTMMMDPTTTDVTTTVTTTMMDEEPPTGDDGDSACPTGLAFGVLLALVHNSL